MGMVSNPMEDILSAGGCQVALYSPQRNKWSVIGKGSPTTAMDWDSIGNDLSSQILSCDGRGSLGMRHFYPVIGTLHLFGQEYLYVMGDDYRFQHLEIYDERVDLWTPLGVSIRAMKNDECIQQKCDQLLNVTQNRQFDAFVS